MLASILPLQTSPDRTHHYIPYCNNVNDVLHSPLPWL